MNILPLQSGLKCDLKPINTTLIGNGCQIIVIPIIISDSNVKETTILLLHGLQNSKPRPVGLGNTNICFMTFCNGRNSFYHKQSTVNVSLPKYGYILKYSMGYFVMR